MKAFQHTQAAFAARIRDPQNQPVPAGIPQQRMAVYETLFFNNLEDLLSSNFPVLHEVLADRWLEVVHAFLIHHRCQTPLFAEIPREFMQFLHEHAESLQLPPFCEELAHYEWVEIGLAAAREDLASLRAQPGLSVEGDVMAGVPILSPLAWILSYQWPVHEISVDYQPETALAQPVWLLVWRDGNLDVQFAWINETVVWLLQQMETGRHSGQVLVERLAAHLRREDLAALQAFTRSLLEDYLHRDILLGVRT